MHSNISQCAYGTLFHCANGVAAALSSYNKKVINPGEGGAEGGGGIRKMVWGREGLHRRRIREKPGRKKAGEQSEKGRKREKTAGAALSQFGERKNPRPEKKPRESKKENAGVWRRALSPSEEECFI